jgi:CBS domain-containing protein
MKKQSKPENPEIQKDVRALMLPLSEYAVVDAGDTVAEAIDVLRRAQSKNLAGHHPHRAVLVRDKGGSIVGKLDHFGFLRTLLPEERTWTDGAMLDRAGVSDDMKDSSIGIFEFLGEDISDACEQARGTTVGEVCSPANARIDPDASLLQATRAFLAHHTLSLLVVERGQTIGILRLVDLFDEFVRQVASDSCEEG